MRSAAKIKARIQITSFDWTSSGFKRHQVVEKTATTLESKPDHSGDAPTNCQTLFLGAPTTTLMCQTNTHHNIGEALQGFRSLQRGTLRTSSLAASCSKCTHVTMSTSVGSAHMHRVFGLWEQCSSHVLPLTCNHCWNNSPCIQKTPPCPFRRCGIKPWTRGIICA